MDVDLMLPPVHVNVASIEKLQDDTSHDLWFENSITDETDDLVHSFVYSVVRMQCH